MTERTLAIIKPDVMKAHRAFELLGMITDHGFKVVRCKKMLLTADEAEEFYAEHKGRPFLPELVAFMTSGPVVVLVLEKDNAILGWREVMGATDPAQAAEGTVRKLFGTNKGSNASHGSDSATAAAREIDFFFPSAPCCG